MKLAIAHYINAQSSRHGGSPDRRPMRFWLFCLPVTLSMFFVGCGALFAQFQANGPRPWIDVTAIAPNPSDTTGGADPTGTYDSTNAINYAISQCNGGTVFFPAGTYLHNGAITVTQSCTLYAVPGTATIVKGFTPTPLTLPAAYGSLLIESSNVTLYGLAYNGNCNGSSGTCTNYGGPCINATTNGTNSISNIILDHLAVYNCDGDPVYLSSSSNYTYDGPTQWVVRDSFITECPTKTLVCGSSSTPTALGAIHLQGTVTSGTIDNNFLDGTESTNTLGPATVQAESQGLTTAITDLQITNNYIKCAGNGYQGWCVQAGGFNAYALTGLAISGNTFNVVNSSGGLSGMVSMQSTVGASVTGNYFNFNGNTNNYTALELIVATGSQVTGNTFYTETPGFGNAITCNVCNNSVISSNKIIGFGESGSPLLYPAGIGIYSTHNRQAISTLSESGSTVTVTVSGMLDPYWQPGTTVCITGAAPTGYNICGMIPNQGYQRATGTFTIYNPTTSLTSCSSGCGYINATDSNNIISANNITLPCQGTLASNRYGVLLRATGTGEIVNDNQIIGNTISGCGNGASGDIGISFNGNGPQGMSYNTIAKNKLMNLSIGVNNEPSATTSTNNVIEGNQFQNVAKAESFGGGSSNATNAFYKDNSYANVTTIASVSGSPTFAATDFETVFANLAACSIAILGQRVQLSNSGTNAFGATITSTGIYHVEARCGNPGGTPAWTVSGN